METIQEHPDDLMAQASVPNLRVPPSHPETYKSTSTMNEMDPVYAFNNADGEDVEVEIDLDKLSPPLPPDGGWGWFIVFGSFICMVLVDGMCFSYGLFLSELEETFGASKMQMTLAGSLLTGFYFMVGPLVSGLLNKFGSREVVLAGTLISSVSILCSTFIYNLNLFIVIFGICGGIGYGCIYLPAATVVTSWFVKKRATVTGIIMAGSGIGGVVYSLVVPSLIEMYTWRGCILLLSGINLNCAVAGALFRPLRPTDYKNEYEENEGNINDTYPNTTAIYKTDPLLVKSSESAVDVNETQAMTRQSNELTSTGEIDHTSSNMNLNRKPKTSIIKLPPETGLNYSSRSKRTSTIDDGAMITYGNQIVPALKSPSTTQNEPVPVMSVEAVNRIVGDILNRQLITSSTSLAPPEFSSKHKLSVVQSPRYPYSSHIQPESSDSAGVHKKSDNFGSNAYFTSVVSLKMPAAELSQLNDPSVCQAIVNELQKEMSRPAYKKDLFLSGSLIHINEFLSTTDVASYIRSVTMPAEEMNIRRPIWSMIKNVLDFGLLKSPTFILLAISSVLSMIGYCVPYQFLKDNGQALGGSESSSSYLLAYLGAMNTAGRILTGWLSDRPWANVLYINNISLVTSGLLTALVPAITVFQGLIGYACLYGFLISAFISVRTILIVQVLGLDRLTSAFGFMLLFQAFAYIGAPPAFGAMYDKFKNFHLIFVLGGLSVLISGILCFPLAILSKWENRKSCQLDENEVPCENNPDQSLLPVRLLRRIRDWFNKYLQCSKKSNNTY
ncbi:Monocarboxylate transporter 1 [Schistosoma japonicum]|nr:Monocarboxylate transporter 1 [Schistosoma japonicum]KAH8852910.1 Monocarboxylate transporter 1 [Schistosoma japonicum]